MKKKIVMCGCKQNGIDVLEYLLNHEIDISYIVSLTPEQAQKSEVSGYASFENISKKYNIPIYYPKEYSLKHKQDIEFFQEQKFDLLILGGWQRLIPEEILLSLKFFGIGVHGSSEFLPKGRGRSPINWSLIEGKQRYIVHLFTMTPNADDGNIIDFDIFDINHWDNCRTLYYKLTILTKKLLAKQIPNILENNFQTYRQKGIPSYYPKRNPNDGEIDWNKDVFEIYNFVRAITRPFPGAYAFLNTKKVYFWNVQPFDSRINYLNKKIGEVVEIFSNGDYVINCNSGLLLVTESDIMPKVGDVFENKN
jgi:methionyl-tRNA formyltransferase